MNLVGITGTNGKTTTTYLLDSIMRAAGHITGIVGTVETRVGGRAARPRVERLRSRAICEALRRDARRRGSRRRRSKSRVMQSICTASMAVRFAVAAFTNLTQDHLDYHHTLEEYFSVKRRLFTDFDVAVRVVNIDDSVRCRARATSSRARSPSAWHDVGACPRQDVRARSAEGARFDLATPEGETVRVALPLAGAYNVSNALVAAGCALGSASASRDDRSRARAGAAGPGSSGASRRGRAVRGHRRLRAHARLAREGDHRGQRGDRRSRDRGLRLRRRSRSRQASARWDAVARFSADHVIVTSDNPRSEDPVGIILQIEDGLADRLRHRRRSRSTAAGRSHGRSRAPKPGDAVLIAGKGHEDYQIFADRTIHFDDREVAARSWRRDADGDGQTRSSRPPAATLLRGSPLTRRQRRGGRFASGHAGLRLRRAAG